MLTTYQNVSKIARLKCSLTISNCTQLTYHVSNDDKIQSDISNIEKWSSTWQLRLNNEKCHFLQLGRKKTEETSYNLTNNTNKSLVPISKVSDVKDLGVHIDDNLNFEKQIAECTKKANGILASIKRTIKFINGDTFKLLYKSLVRPILELTGSVWNPYKLKHIRSLESVQRRATKLVRAIKDLPYEDRLRTLDLPTLAYRRCRGDMILTFKIFKGYINIDPNIFFKLNGNMTRGHSLKIYKKRANTTIRKNFFSQRVINQWNDLPASIIESTSVLDFEKAYDRHMSDNKFAVS